MKVRHPAQVGSAARNKKGQLAFPTFAYRPRAAKRPRKTFRANGINAGLYLCRCDSPSSFRVPDVTQALHLDSQGREVFSETH